MVKTNMETKKQTKIDESVPEDKSNFGSKYKGLHHVKEE